MSEDNCPTCGLHPKRDFIAMMHHATEQANLNANAFAALLESNDIISLVRTIMHELPPEVAVSCADTMLANLGMVAVNRSHYYGDDDPPHIVAMKAWCWANGFVALEADEFDMLVDIRDRAERSISSAKCPACSSPQLAVKDSRKTEHGTRRRRRCVKCGHDFFTIEIREPKGMQPKDRP